MPNPTGNQSGQRPRSDIKAAPNGPMMRQDMASPAAIRRALVRKAGLSYYFCVILPARNYRT